MREVFEVQRTTEQANKTGGVSKVFATTVTIRGQFRNRSPREVNYADQQRGVATQDIVIRYHPDVTPKSRLLHRDSGRVFDIEAVNNIEERNREMQLVCQEVVE